MKEEVVFVHYTLSLSGFGALPLPQHKLPVLASRCGEMTLFSLSLSQSDIFTSSPDSTSCPQSRVQTPESYQVLKFPWAMGHGLSLPRSMARQPGFSLDLKIWQFSNFQLPGCQVPKLPRVQLSKYGGEVSDLCTN